MNSTSKKDYMRIIQNRYLKASKKQKGRILDEISVNLGIHRKSANRLVRSNLSKKRKIKDPLYIYSERELFLLERIWKESYHPSSAILKASLPDYLPHLKNRFPIDVDTEKQLLAISARTIDRRLIKKKKAYLLKISSTTKQNRPLYKHVPIRTCSRSIKNPGSLEIDTVAHCGFSNSGHFIYTVNSVDIATGWIARRAVLGKGALGVKDAITQIIDEIPFTIHEIDSDNGDEFLNFHFIKYCEATGLKYFRSRPYKKNDQAHIEQKNSTHVRRIFGRLRLDSPAVLALMNDLYKNELMLFHNFFKPSQKLLSKTFDGPKTIRTFEKVPLTPYKRVLASRSIPVNTKDRLTALFQSLDPFELKNTIDKKLSLIFHTQHAGDQHEIA